MTSQYQLDKCFIKIAIELSQLSKCVSYKVGSVLTIENRIISTGYNGTSINLLNCNDKFKLDFDRDEHNIWSIQNEIHAELNAILFSTKTGIILQNSTLYSTLQPCIQCLKHICQIGIKRIVYFKPYDKVYYTTEIKKNLNKLNIKIEQFKFKTGDII